MDTTDATAGTLGSGPLPPDEADAPLTIELLLHRLAEDAAAKVCVRSNYPGLWKFEGRLNSLAWKLHATRLRIGEEGTPDRRNLVCRIGEPGNETLLDTGWTAARIAALDLTLLGPTATVASFLERVLDQVDRRRRAGAGS